jgi:lipid-A-disaccharide synthase
MKNIGTLIHTKFTVVFLFFASAFFCTATTKINAYPIACLITGEQSGEELADWFLRKTELHKTHILHALASKDFCKKLSLHSLDGFDTLRNVNIMGGVGNLCKQFCLQQSTYTKLCDQIIALKPDKVILVDLPWVNLRLARQLKKSLPSTLITFIAPPELWFWGCWRIDKWLQQYCDECIVLYPHEQSWYAAKGIKTTWLGYPYEAEFHSFIEQDPTPTACLALLPGSRELEVLKSLPLMCKAVKQCVNLNNFTIIVIKPPSISEQLLATIIADQGLSNKIKIVQHTDRTQLSHCFYALTKPGTITLHLALLGVPHAVIFKSSWINKIILNYLIQPKALGLPNLLCFEPMCDEFIQEAANPTALAQHLDAVYEAFQKGKSCYKLRRHRVDLFRKAFLKDEN